ncbi:zinc finger protein Xfin isoform X2 [Thalassophryne amazonica]|uniref:zinc finger protein Xfin isoform X2 n=1 Tax=Thalassophryne amazonica TaxID=390379 RepID=UPI0014713F36|nr:zinc finger protein Xfin isoform X2 [Thalassophryne amazonica]
MAAVKQRYNEISPVTLQVVGGMVSSTLYCSTVEGVAAANLVESFLVEVFRCKLCQFTCSLKSTICSHVLDQHHSPALPYMGRTSCEGVANSGSEVSGFQHAESPYQLTLNGGSKQNEEDEEFLLPMYSMLENMSPPTCDITTYGGLPVAHTCEVSTLFEEDEDESTIFPLKGDSVDLTCPASPSSSHEETAQSAHLMTLGLCRISATRAPPSAVHSVACPPPSDDDVRTSRRADSLSGRMMPSRNQRLPCVLCPLTLPSRRLLDVHVRSHQTEGGFCCPSCSWSAISWEELEHHWRSHSRKRSFNKSTEQKRQKKKKRFSCCVCRQVFRSAASLITHCRTHDNCLQHRHGNHSGWTHRKAGRTGTKKVDLPQRDQSVLQQLAVGGASWRISRKQSRGREECKETPPPPAKDKSDFSCVQCHRNFSTKLTLRRHMGVHGSDKPHRCPHCAYSSRLKASLLQHLRTHTGEKPYRCSECLYASIDRSSLLRHYRTHSQEKPYRCSSCTYSSIQKKSLDLHTRRHHTGKVFSCQLCPYSSPDRQLLLRHVRKYHPPPCEGAAEDQQKSDRAAV